ncbi:MAG TPA: GTP-binding protein [Candidatus Paceibacterota bacterium]|nr:GTP-binding protein [Candidatus Paceibacterota bacterium]HRZ29232.1 GTP-binding protein [Candidatus Paceibacterota bacterium]
MPIKNKESVPRPPIVVVTGHIDHGKTTLLSYIRHNKSILVESGNITQHIAAYEIEIDVENQKRKITFLDTPGHEAFSSLRSRGAKIADIAILIIAADEGFKPQTQEALEHIRVNDIPFIVAINKIDRPNANVEKVKNELAQHDIFIEGRGGNVPCIEISAKDGTNVDDLLEMIILLSDLAEAKANPNNIARGFVLESHMDAKCGFTATLIIKDGTLHIGDNIVTSNTDGKIKMLKDFLGKNKSTLTFSSPAIVVGFNDLPESGSEFIAGDVITDELINSLKQNIAIDFCRNQVIGENTEKVINILVKTDCIGSCEALIHSLQVLAKNLNVSFKIIDNNIGNINEKDVKLADLTKSAIINFRMKSENDINNFIETKNIKIYYGDTIYEILEQIENDVLSQEEEKPKIVGQVKILAKFNNVKDYQVIGGEVFDGKININDQFSIERDNQDIGKGKIVGIQCQKQKVNSLGSINECGLMIDSKTIIETNDLLKFYI